MSPRKFRRRNLMDQSISSTNIRSKACSLTPNKKTLQYDEQDLENQEKDQTNVFLNNSQQKQKLTKSSHSLRKKIYMEKSKKCYSSSKSPTSPKNLKLKENEDVIQNNSLIDIHNISYELLKKSPMQLRNTSMHYNKMKQLNTSANLDRNSKEENMHNNSLNGTITPKCSPISVTLTPLRTTKTPKKSPVNLASPKVPPEVPLRLSKTPRKLKLCSSPTIPASFDRSLQNKNNIDNNDQNTTLGNVSMNDAGIKSNKLRKSRTSTEKSKLMQHKSSKTQKIILRVSSSKSEFKTTKTKLDNQKLKRLKNNVFKKVSPFSTKNGNNDKSLSSEESQLELTLTNINNLSEEYKEIISKEPIVLLERIPLLDSLSISLKTKGNQRLTDTTLDVAKYVQKQLFKNLSSLKHSISHTSHKYPVKTEEMSKSSNNKVNVELDNRNSIISSTPLSNRSSNSFFTPILFTNERVKQDALVEDDVKNSTYDISETSDNRNNTMVIENEETAIADETYDILEPGTPHLLGDNRKSTAVEADNNKKEVKKTVKVRFTTPERQMERLKSNNNIAIRKTPRVKYISHKRSNSLSNTPSDRNKPTLIFERRSVSTSNIHTTPSKSSSKKQKRLSSPSIQMKSGTECEKKKDIKARSYKTKIPNFVEIHKQIFAKMESIVDNKKRLMQKHETLKTPKTVRLDKNNMKKLKSIETKKNEGCNRFGFRVKKNDASNIILRKQTDVQSKKREETKAFLNGVRTNRRFELLMKMRKLSH